MKHSALDSMDLNIKLVVVLQKLNQSLLSRLEKNLLELKITPSMYTMLAHLYNVKKETTQKLGEKAFVTSGTITHLVNKLKKRKFVTKIKDKTDNRVYWIEITNKGETFFQSIHQQHKVYLDSLLSTFDYTTKHELIKQLKYFGKEIERGNYGK
ncbi:MAG: MarR family transcriptional regulator [Candidatus Izimaplasma sp.]|nr:MarR family transcriptional regulator [Candidatus Izimaplasma bacterium]